MYWSIDVALWSISYSIQITSTFHLFFAQMDLFQMSKSQYTCLGHESSLPSLSLSLHSFSFKFLDTKFNSSVPIFEFPYFHKSRPINKEHTHTTHILNILTYLWLMLDVPYIPTELLICFHLMTLPFPVLIWTDIYLTRMLIDIMYMPMQYHISFPVLFYTCLYDPVHKTLWLLICSLVNYLISSLLCTGLYMI